MNPILFPYTYLSPQELEPISTVFGKLLIYQPLGKLLPADLEEPVRAGEIEVRTPLKGNDRKLMAILKEFRTWADLHHTSQREYHKMINRLNLSAPDPMSSQIRREIKDRMSGEKECDPIPPSDRARVFLALAQEFDTQQTGLSRAINQIQGMQQKLFVHLKGDGFDGPDSFSSPESSQPKSQAYMISDRLSAWSRLLYLDTNPPRVFITTSDEAFQMVTDQAGSVHTLPGFNRRPMDIAHKENPWKGGRRLIEYLDQIVKAENDALPVHSFEEMDAPAADGRCTVRLTATLVPNRSPAEVFSKLIHPPINETPPPDLLCRNTVLVLMQLPVEV